MKGSKYCYGHERLMAARTQDLELPPLEDANAIVLSLTKGLQAMMKGQMDQVGRDVFLRHADRSQRDGESKVWGGRGAVRSWDRKSKPYHGTIRMTLTGKEAERVNAGAAAPHKRGPNSTRKIDSLARSYEKTIYRCESRIKAF